MNFFVHRGRYFLAIQGLGQAENLARVQGMIVRTTVVSVGTAQDELDGAGQNDVQKVVA